MKKSFLGILAAIFLMAGSAFGQVVTGFDDILVWVGSGDNRAGLVIDFHDGQSKQSFVWGFRWIGEATGYDMLEAISDADINLTVSTLGFINTISYQAPEGLHSQTGGTFASFPDDFVSWGYYLAGGEAEAFDENWDPLGPVAISGGGINLPVSWTLSPAGTQDRYLSDGAWDAFSYGAVSDAPDYEHQAPPSNTAFAAIPEPSTVLLLVLAGGGALWMRSRKSSS